MDYYSCKGCTLCKKGAKLVLFATGICPRNCWYCPLSEHKKNKDVVYADEWKTDDIKEILQEAKLIKAEGAGITGGDPLSRLDRTLTYITTLKKEFGKKFHIHLYTSLDLVNEENLKKLHQAGLDEIRFHPDIENDKLWNKLELAKNYNWDCGIEIPAIPEMEEQTKKLIDYAKNKVNFININELEYSEINYEEFEKRKLQTKEPSYAVQGSEELGIKLAKYAQKLGLKARYCSAQFKDDVQLRNRIKRRAQSVKKSFDVVTEEGMLVRGALYLDELKPGTGYREKLEKADKPALITKLQEISKHLGIKHEIDTDKPRIIFDAREAERIAKKHKNVAIVEEYPTKDALEVNLEFLS